MMAPFFFHHFPPHVSRDVKKKRKKKRTLCFVFGVCLFVLSILQVGDGCLASKVMRGETRLLPAALGLRAAA